MQIDVKMIENRFKFDEEELISLFLNLQKNKFSQRYVAHELLEFHNPVSEKRGIAPWKLAFTVDGKLDCR